MAHNYIGEAVGQRIAYRLRMAYYAKMQRMSFSYHDRNQTGQLMIRATDDVAIGPVRMVPNVGRERGGRVEQRPHGLFGIRAGNQRQGALIRVRVNADAA